MNDNHAVLREVPTRRRYVTVDVFADQPFGGNPLAVVTAAIAHLAQLGRSGTVQWRISQGVDMGRPSLLLGTTEQQGSQLQAVRLAGHVVLVMKGMLQALA